MVPDFQPQLFFLRQDTENAETLDGIFKIYAEILFSEYSY